MKRLNIDLDNCPRCDVEFTAGVSKTKHHAIPKFMNPKSNIIIPLCEPCHKELNASYIHELKKSERPVKSKDFKQFLETYNGLRDKFKAGGIHRGQFGEGLWENLVAYLQSQQK